MEKIMNAVIAVDNVSFSYHGTRALERLSFQVEPGEVLGLLGPNGAGKTTTVRLLNGLLKPDVGSIHVMDMDPLTQGNLIRSQSGVLTEISALYERLTAWQNLEFFGGLHGLSSDQIRTRGAELLHFFDLTDRADQRVETYSKGMKQRLALVRVLLHQPPLLYLDEPTSGLDPEASKKVIDLMLTFRQQAQHAMLICTHNLTVAEKLCDRLLIMRQGSMLAEGSLEELRHRFVPGLQVDISLLKPAPNAETLLSSQAGVQQVEVFDGQHLRIHVLEEAVIPVLLNMLMRAGVLLTGVVPTEKSLEDVYIGLQEENHEAA
jgi:ABC-2 type transport system ATP-binding protein